MRAFHLGNVSVDVEVELDENSDNGSNRPEEQGIVRISKGLTF